MATERRVHCVASWTLSSYKYDGSLLYNLLRHTLLKFLCEIKVRNFCVLFFNFSFLGFPRS